MTARLGHALSLLIAGLLLWFSLAKEWWMLPVTDHRSVIYLAAGVAELILAAALAYPYTRVPAAAVVGAAFSGAVVGSAVVLAFGYTGWTCKCLGAIRLSASVAMIVQSGIATLSGLALLLMGSEPNKPRLAPNAA